MNCTYYIVFEQNYKKYQWWIDKKARIDQTIKDFDSKDPAAKAKAENQTKVMITILSGKYNFILPSLIEILWKLLAMHTNLVELEETRIR